MLASDAKVWEDIVLCRQGESEMANDLRERLGR